MSFRARAKNQLRPSCSWFASHVETNFLRITAFRTRSPLPIYIVGLKMRKRKPSKIDRVDLPMHQMKNGWKMCLKQSFSSSLQIFIAIFHGFTMTPHTYAQILAIHSNKFDRKIRRKISWSIAKCLEGKCFLNIVINNCNLSIFSRSFIRFINPIINWQFTESVHLDNDTTVHLLGILHLRYNYSCFKSSAINVMLVIDVY